MRHRIVQTCNLTYSPTVTFVTIAAASLSARHPSKIDKDGRRHYLIRAIPYQDPQQEAERLKAVHEARVKIVPRV